MSTDTQKKQDEFGANNKIFTKEKADRAREILRRKLCQPPPGESLHMAQTVDVTEAASEAGFSCPVYVTEEVWDRCVKWSEADKNRQGYQEEDARLWDVLFAPALKMRFGLGSVDVPGGMDYEIYCILRDENGTRDDGASLIRLRVVPVYVADKDSLVIMF